MAIVSVYSSQPMLHTPCHPNQWNSILRTHPNQWPLLYSSQNRMATTQWKESCQKMATSTVLKGVTMATGTKVCQPMTTTTPYSHPNQWPLLRTLPINGHY
ncbi:unnamed protein product, partial [Staurois parvus]